MSWAFLTMNIKFYLLLCFCNVIVPVVGILYEPEIYVLPLSSMCWEPILI